MDERKEKRKGSARSSPQCGLDGCRLSIFLRLDGRPVAVFITIDPNIYSATAGTGAAEIDGLIASVYIRFIDIIIYLLDCLFWPVVVVESAGELFVSRFHITYTHTRSLKGFLE